MNNLVSIDIAASIKRVWAEAIDFGAHAEWMKDARSIRFEDAERRGVGAVLLIETRVGPLRTVDRFEITAIEPMRKVTGRHLGLFTGDGAFELSELGPGLTRFAWRERIRFPWYFGGPLGAWLAKPILARIWRSNLAALKRRIEHDR